MPASAFRNRPPEISPVKRLLASASLAALALALPPAAPLPFVAPSALAQQGPVTLENLSFKSEFATISIPRIMVEGSSLGRAEIEALFDPAQAATLGQRLSKLSARSVTVPTIELGQTMPDGSATTIYRDMVLRDIRDGVVAEGTMAGASTAVKSNAGGGAPKTIEVAMGGATLKGLDLPQYFRFLFGKAEAGDTLRTALAEMTFGKTTIQAAGLADFSVAEFSGRDFKLRPLKTPYVELMRTLQAQAKTGSKPDDKAMLGVAADILGAMSFGDMRMKGLTGSVTPPGQPAMRVGIDQIAMAGGADVAGRFQLQGLKIGNGADRFDIGEFAVEGVSLAGMMGALDRLAAPDGGIAALDPAAMIPKIDVVRVSGVDFDVPDTKNPKQRIKAKLGLFETKMSNHVGAIPANVAIAVDRFQMDLPADSKESGLQELLAMGYKALDVSARYDQSWNEAAKTLRLNELSLRSAGMFNANAKAEIVNVPREIFTMDKAVASVALLGAAAKSVQIRVVNESLFEKLIAKQARDARRKVEDVRAELAAGATMMVPMFLGDHPAAKTVGTALGRFVAEPKNLNVTVTAKGEGLGATDFIAVSNPLELLNKVDIQAAANQ
jgi:hypothetical protein